ncbi:glycoside hydrolase family 3 N-terminal domain-containing protein [Bacteroidota bacterium]
MRPFIYSFCILIVLLFACNSNKNKTDAYLNPEVPVEKRVELLLNEMTLEEKIGQMCQYVGEPSTYTSANKDEQVNYVLSLGERANLIKEGKIGSFLKVPTYKEANELQKLAEQSRLKIPLLIATDAIHGHGMYQGATTIYPTEIGIATTFDTSLAYKIAKYTAREMRATGYHWTFSPNIDIVRDPRWGRSGETFGEDPYVVAMMGISMIRGYQGDGFSHTDNVIACVKHFVAGGISYNGLNGAATDISERTLHEIFFPPFVEAIKSEVYTLMPAHNEINGIPCHAHQEYLTHLIRNSWGFQGFIISDWMDIERLQEVHEIVGSHKEAAKTAVLAGLDAHMHGPGFFENMKELVEEGIISEKRINEAVRKILYAKFQLGLFENRYADSAQVINNLLKEEHLELALDAARKSIVLLQNENNTLPLNKEIKSIFITGPNANNQALLGDWSRIQPEENVVTVLEGIKKSVSVQTKIDYLPCKSYNTISNSLLAEAKKKAAMSDIAIVVVGDNSIRFDRNKTSGENLDRSTLELPGDQASLLKTIESSGTPVIMVLVNGGPIASQWMVENVEGIIEAWEPGMFGGQAIAEVIFGEYNPGGRLPVTIPRSVGHIQSFYNHKPSSFHRGHFYDSESKPLFKFGHGLSYTQFQYDNLVIPKKISLQDDLELSFTLENTGSMAGDEVILIYINDKISSVTTPVKKLVAFDRIHLKSEERKDMEFKISNTHFKLFDKEMNFVIEPGYFDIIVGKGYLSAEILIE